VFQTGTQLKCKNCRCTGHTETKCWAKGGGQEGQYPDWYEGKKDAHTSDTVKPVTDMPIVWSHGSASQPDIWFSNSAATVHISPIREDFTTYREYDKCQDIKTFGKNTVKGIGEGDILAEINFQGKTKKIRLTNVMHIPGADGKVLSLKVLDQRGFESRITGGRIRIMKGTEVYTEASLGEELYEVKMKIVPSQEMAAIKSQETRANIARKERTRPEGRPSGRISNKVLIMRVTSDAPEIKIPKTKHEAKLEETYIGTCSHEEELTRDTHQDTLQDTLKRYQSMGPMPDEDLQRTSASLARLDRLEEQVANLLHAVDIHQNKPELSQSAPLEAKKTQPSDTSGKREIKYNLH